MLDPIGAAWNTVARFDDYEATRRAVDRCPVQVKAARAPPSELEFPG